MGLLSHSLNALSLTLTQGKEGGEDFSVLTLRHNKAFSCFYANEKPPSGIEASLSIIRAKRPIECVIDSIPKEGFTPLENAFFQYHLFYAPTTIHFTHQTQSDAKTHPFFF